jgi:threonine synthase
MIFASMRHPAKQAGFREALFAGLAPDGGLYHPVAMPDLSSLFASFDDSTDFIEVASRMGAALLAPELSGPEAERLARAAFTFSPALRPLGPGIQLLELFHGPTCAFKDFGAQYLAAAMEHFLGAGGRRIQILVATSGDTGSAVARAFHGRASIDVVILYPSGRVSDLQEKQLTTLGGNVHALEVAGSFDDCQRLVKEAFQDPALTGRLRLTSANSINIGRLLPQCFYYAWAATRRTALGGRPPVICVPSGNFGNLTAGVYAWRWGLPAAGFIAATNANDVVPVYLRTGRFDPRPSARTLSNAMDVGNPSNFERLRELFTGDWREMAARIEGRAVSDARTLRTMAEIHDAAGVFVDPHTAVGCAAAADRLAGLPPGTAPDSPAPRPAPGGASADPLIVLSTAHPAKFSDIVLGATGAEPPIPERLARCLGLPKRAVAMGTSLATLSEFLLDSFG